MKLYFCDVNAYQSGPINFRNQDNEQAMDWTIQGSIPGWGNIIFSSLVQIDHLCSGPPSLLLTGYQRLFLQG
jgi:hypothetical protein